MLAQTASRRQAFKKGAVVQFGFELSHSHRGFSPVIGTRLYLCGTVSNGFTWRDTEAVETAAWIRKAADSPG
jgi:hypothetical protein